MIRLNRARITTVALFSLMAGPAHAQRLFEMDGIELRGSARVLQYGAGTCNVLEHVETATEYERKKANHGQPVDLWQLDLSVYNGSGKPLDHLIARYGIAAESPPCTNWTSPEAGQIPGHMEWGDWYGTIQRSGSGDPTAPGETLARTVYLLVFREHQPRFDTWSVDYNFAADPATPPAARTETKPSPSAPRTATAPATTASDGIDYGDDASLWARDGECDDPRFEGPGTAETLLEQDRAHDATDCRTLFEQGQIWLRPDATGIDYGDDASPWARDGECDDPRFEGPGTDETLLEQDRAHDATDCRTLFEQGQIRLRPGVVGVDCR